jgi:hypothetical protein
VGIGFSTWPTVTRLAGASESRSVSDYFPRTRTRCIQKPGKRGPKSIDRTLHHRAERRCANGGSFFNHPLGVGSGDRRFWSYADSELLEDYQYTGDADFQSAFAHRVKTRSVRPFRTARSVGPTRRSFRKARSVGLTRRDRKSASEYRKESWRSRISVRSLPTSVIGATTED